MRKINVPLSGPGLQRGPASSGGRNEPPVASIRSHPAVRPSLINSNPCISSGSRGIDSLLQHGGLPLGSLLLLEENGTGDFASSILKSFACYGVHEKRNGKASIIICLGIPDYLRMLPAVAKSKSMPAEPKPAPKGEMKIAWRYKPLDTPKQVTKDALDFNFRANLMPAPQPSEVVYIVGKNLLELLLKLEAYLERQPANLLCRVIVPSFLHPAVYSMESSEPKALVPFYLRLCNLVKKYQAVALVSLSLHLYPRVHPLTVEMECLSDSCVELVPFEDPEVQGFIDVHRVCDLSDTGHMCETKQQFAFKLGKTQFEVSAWAIPVEEGEEKELY